MSMSASAVIAATVTIATEIESAGPLRRKLIAQKSRILTEASSSNG